MDLIFAYLAGLLTLINPCILPVLPIVMASAAQVSRAGPVALAAGMSLSFVALGVGVTAFGRAVGLTVDDIAQAGAWLMVAFGVVLLTPRAASGLALATGGVSAAADARLETVDRGSLGGQFAGGLLLGAVWAPCIGPTLGGAIALASTGQSLGWVTAIMTAFAAGVSSVVLALGYGAQSAIRARRDRLRALAVRGRPVMGVLFVLTGLALALGAVKAAEIWLIETLPIWLQDLSVRF